MRTDDYSTRRQLLVLAMFLGLCAVVAGLGSVMSASAMDGWYGRLEQPGWDPPDWVFGPVWSVLYVLIAVSGWLVWRARGWFESRAALIAWGVQLALNLLWTAVFFGLEQPGLATVEIAFLWMAIVANIVMFWFVSRLAAVLLVPYLIWVTYAAALTFSIWRLN
jgi:translocator protein